MLPPPVDGGDDFGEVERFFYFVDSDVVNEDTLQRGNVQRFRSVDIHTPLCISAPMANLHMGYIERLTRGPFRQAVKADEDEMMKVQK